MRTLPIVTVALAATAMLAAGPAIVEYPGGWASGRSRKS